jgi:dTDP-4-amino-4,6-dideoxygalactose transaminase
MSLDESAMQSPVIPLFKPLIQREEMDAARDALELGWLGMGSYVGAFEKRLEQFIDAGDRRVVALSTGHAALHLGLLVAGVGPGDEVITPSFNNVADFQAILAVGAEPVFCDVDEESLCVDLEKAAALLSPRTKAIIVMDYYCMLCDHERVARFASDHGVRVLHDAAHSFGSRCKGRMVGSFSDLAMFSFDPVKTITCIDGGALIVRSQEELRRLKEMRLLGMGQLTDSLYANSRARSYDIERIGFRYHMANLHAALGLAQLAKIDVISETRRRACQRYNEQLGGLPSIRVPMNDFADITPFLYYIRVPAERRDGLRDHLGARGIETGIHWPPGHWFTLFKSCRRGDLSVTERISREILSIPLHSCMSPETVDRVVDGIGSFFRHADAS